MSSEPRLYPTEPWGAHRPRGPAAALLRASRALPRVVVLKQLGHLLRSVARPRMGPAVDVRLWGHRLRFLPTGNIAEGRLIFFPDGWDAEERRLLQRHLREDDVVVDVGANVGGYVWWVLHVLGGGCEIVAFEPDPELAAGIEFNLATNAVRNARVIRAAAAPVEGEGVLVLGEANRGENRVVTEPAPEGADTRTVRAAPLLRLLEDAGLERVDVLKVDIEGLEPAVLGAFFADAPGRLWPRLLVVEHKDTPEHRALSAALGERGYRLLSTTRLNRLWLRKGAGAGPA